MFDYFKTMHAVAEADERNYTSIRDLTIDVAKSGGYRREDFVYKNGKHIIRTVYNKPSTWDNALVAKWYCFYEKAFYSKLIKHPEFSEYYTFILDRTFTILFNSLQLDKLVCDSVVTALFNMSLANRIGEVLYNIGSKKRLEDYNSGKGSKKILLSTAINHMSTSIESLSEDYNYNPSYFDENLNPTILDLRDILKDNNYGDIVLQSLLYSDKKVNITKLNNFIDIPNKTPEALNSIKDAYIKITNYLYNSIEDNSILKNSLKDKYKKIVGCKKLNVSFGEEFSI